MSSLRLFLACCVALLPALAITPAAAAPRTVTFKVRDTAIEEVMEMLATTEQVNILLAPTVTGNVSFSLYDVPLDDAIRSIANAGGFIVEKRGNTFFVLDRSVGGRLGDSDFTEVRLFRIEYADVAAVQMMLQPYLSEFGHMTALESGRRLLVEDSPAFLSRIAGIIDAVDVAPRQILIEARILEVTLNDDDAFGIDWTRFFSGGDLDAGTRGLSGSGASAGTGFVLNVNEQDLIGTLTALESDGRIRTLSTPTLLVVENEEASVIVGDRRGYQVTTTINQITTESIEFLESGVILRVTPSVDSDDRITMYIHPEVSNGSVDTSGIPSQTTTEVTTRLVIDSGDTAFVGGLIKQTTTSSRSGVPVVSRIPLLGRLFTSRESSSVNTETVVLIRPLLVDDALAQVSLPALDRVDDIGSDLDRRQRAIDRLVEQEFGARDD